MSNTSYQTSYGKRPTGFKGQVATNQPVITLNGAAAEAIEVGVFAKYADGQVSNLVDVNSVVDCLVVKSDVITTVHKANDSVTRGKKGAFYVYCETAIDEGVNPYIRYTANGSLNVGDIRADDDTAKAKQNTKVTTLEKITAAGLVKVQIEL